MEMMIKYELMWDRHLERITVEMDRSVLHSSDALPIHSAPFRAGPKKQEPGREEVKKMKEAAAAEPIVTEWASSIVFVSKKGSIARFLR